MNVIRVRATYAPTAKFTTWLYTLAHNRLVDHWRAHGPGRRCVSIDDDDDDPRATRSTRCRRARARRARSARERTASSARACMRRCAALPAAQRDAFLLQQEGGLSLAEIAALTGVGVETVKSRLRYAVAKLRSWSLRSSALRAARGHRMNRRPRPSRSRARRGVARAFGGDAAAGARRGDPRRRASRGDERAEKIDAGRAATRPWRWWMPLAAAAAIGVIAIGALQLLPQEPDPTTGRWSSDMPATGAKSAAPRCATGRLVSAAATARSDDAERAAMRRPRRLRRSARRRAAAERTAQPRRAPRQSRAASGSARWPPAPSAAPAEAPSAFASREEQAVGANASGARPVARAQRRCGASTRAVTCAGGRELRLRRPPNRARTGRAGAHRATQSARRRAGIACAACCVRRGRRCAEARQARGPRRRAAPADRPTNGSRASAACAPKPSMARGAARARRISRRLSPMPTRGFPPDLRPGRRRFRATRSAAVRRDARASAAACGSAPAARRRSASSRASHSSPGASARRGQSCTAHALRMQRQREMREAVRDRRERGRRARHRRRKRARNTRARRRRAQARAGSTGRPRCRVGGRCSSRIVAAALEQQHAHGALRQHACLGRGDGSSAMRARVRATQSRATGQTSQRGRRARAERRAEVHQRLRVGRRCRAAGSSASATAHSARLDLRRAGKAVRCRDGARARA